MLTRSCFVACLCVLATAFACGGTVHIGDDEVAPDVLPSSNAPDAAPSSTDAGSSLPAGDGVVACPYGLPADHPNDPTATYQRHCATKSDCAIAFHLMDCCGNRRALGVEPGEVARFASGICAGGGAVCGCPEDRPTAETSERAPSFDANEIDVRCVNAVCKTYVATFACDTTTCDARTQYCRKFIPGIGNPDGGSLPPSYSCQPIPSACADSPDCACFENGMPAGNSCAESNGHVTITLVGF